MDALNPVSARDGVLEAGDRPRGQHCKLTGFLPLTQYFRKMPVLPVPYRGRPTKSPIFQGCWRQGMLAKYSQIRPSCYRAGDAYEIVHCRQTPII